MEKALFLEIGENHHRGIGTALVFLDENLCEFEKLVKSNGIKSVLYSEKNVFSPGQRKKILFEIEVIRKILKELKDTLKLNERVNEIDSTIWGHCSGLWEVLVETESKYLKRYGEIPPGLPDYLDPKIAEIIESIKKISSVACQK